MSVIQAGQLFGYLRTVERRRLNGRSEWLCVCQCGNRKWIAYTLLQGAVRPVKSCGCKRIDLLRAAQTTHGASVESSPLYPTFISWQSMLWRCYNVNRNDYPSYGGRGIVVCKRWRSFTAFLEDMGSKPTGMSLGRINNNKGYSPDNCRWETVKEQARNKRTNTVLLFKGKKRTLIECSEMTGIQRSTIGKRLEAGWSVSDSLTKQVRRANNG